MLAAGLGTAAGAIRGGSSRFARQVARGGDADAGPFVAVVAKRRRPCGIVDDAIEQTQHDHRATVQVHALRQHHSSLQAGGSSSLAQVCRDINDASTRNSRIPISRFAARTRAEFGSSVGKHYVLEEPNFLKS